MPPLHILCFGASLVEGYTSNGTRLTPYSTRLAEIIRQHRITQRDKEEEVDVVVDTDGMSGDLVTGGFEGRMRTRCEYSFLFSTFYFCKVFVCFLLMLVSFWRYQEVRYS